MDQSTSGVLSARGGRLWRGGEPAQILAGSLHYFRVHPAQWHDRLLRLADMGLNAVDTYVAWNVHQPVEGAPADFTGWRDIERFCAEAQAAGLDVVLRPGPYICAEWTNGGLPVWLTGRRIPLRTADERFLGPVAEWFRTLLPRLAPLQASHGGPIVAVQVENEFGSYGDDPDYVPAVRELLRENGIVELLYTADGPTGPMADAGSLDDVLTAYNFGSRAEEARAFGHARKPDEPFFAAEFWNGWFDHWGEKHHVRDAHDAAATVAEIVRDGGSISIYMAHGGTNFGAWAGSNHTDEDGIQPTVTSYDSDAPIAEDGRLTEKFFAIREVLGRTDPPRSAQPRILAPRTVALRPGAGILAAAECLAGAPRELYAPAVFDALGFRGPLALAEAEVRLPDRPVRLRFAEVRDRAFVFVDGALRGVIEGSGVVEFDGAGGPARIQVLVESFGHINFGPRLGDPKGILGPVDVDRRLVQRWRVRDVPLGSVDEAALAAVAGDPADGGLATASFEIDEPLDAHLALDGASDGYVWVNGFLLGRYRESGPQRTLYVPAPVLRAGSNSLAVLDLRTTARHARFVSEPELGPTEQYIEEL